MPWWMAAYVILFGVLLVGNAVFWLKNGGKLWVLLYELSSGIYLLYTVFAFWYPAVLNYTTPWPLLAIPGVLIFECYYSIWGDTEELVPDGEMKMSPAEMEFAKAFSVVMAAPAYLTAAKLFINTFL